MHVFVDETGELDYSAPVRYFGVCTQIVRFRGLIDFRLCRCQDESMSDERSSTNSQAPPDTSGDVDEISCKHKNSKFQLELLGTIITLLGLGCFFCIVGLKWLVLALAALVIIMSPFLAIYGPYSCNCVTQSSTRKKLTAREFWTRFLVLTVGFVTWVAMALFGSPLGVFLVGVVASLGGFKLLQASRSAELNSNREKGVENRS